MKKSAVADLRPGVMVMWSKIFDHDHSQDFLNEPCRMVKILTMTTVKIHIFDGQNGEPKNSQNFTTTFDHIIPILTIDHSTDSRVPMVMVQFFGANSRVPWSWSVLIPPP